MLRSELIAFLSIALISISTFKNQYTQSAWIRIDKARQYSTIDTTKPLISGALTVLKISIELGIGTGGRTRTDTLLKATDFESFGYLK